MKKYTLSSVGKGSGHISPLKFSVKKRNPKLNKYTFALCIVTFSRQL